MNPQYIKINMVPNGVVPVLYCSQYDVGRPLGMVVYNGSETVDLDDYTVTLEATRTDGTAITAAITTDGNVCALETTATMTNKADRYPAQIVVADGNGNRIASIPIKFVVVPAALDENAESIEEDKSLYQQYTGTVQTLIAEIRTELIDLKNAKIQRFDTVAQMIADTTLKAGMYVRTGGFASVGDGGDALYRIYNNIPDDYYETLSNGLYAKGIVDESSVLNWNGSTIEKKVQDFLQNATNGEKLDLKGAQINVTEGFTKTNYSYLTYCIISNAIINIPASIGGWLSIDGDSGYRSPMFENCTFIGGGSIFHESSYNFQAVGCVFHDVQILNGDYIQACYLSGCNIMNRNHYLIECNWAFSVTMTQCIFEAGNKGAFYGKGNSNYASITHGAFNACVFEGFTDAVLKTNGATAVNFENCYVEKVPYLMYDSKAFRDVFYVSIRGGFIDNSSINNKFTIYSDATYPFLNVSDLQFNGGSSHYLCNLKNSNRIITSSNRGEKYLFGANGGKTELIKNNYAFNGKSFSFSTNGTSIYSQPQAFMVIISSYSNTPILFTRVSILTLNYRPSTNGYTVTETPLVSNSSMSETITWTATSDNVLGLVTVTGSSTSTVSISVVNLGATMSGMIV